MDYVRIKAQHDEQIRQDNRLYAAGCLLFGLFCVGLFFWG
jgi:hypothetical protein